jgi:hypothetical protein
VTYLSGPITTGPRYIRQLRTGVLDAESIRAIRSENIRDILATAKRLRQQRSEIIIEPASLRLPEWSQRDYHTLWERLIEHHIHLAIFMPGWEYSHGCAVEFAHASAHDIRTETLSGSFLSIEEGISLLALARNELLSEDENGALLDHAAQLKAIIDRLAGLLKPAAIIPKGLRKDESLNELAERGMNVAQFVSFSPGRKGPQQEYSRVAGRKPNESFPDLRSALNALLEGSHTQSINVRSYQPHDAQAREFIYGLKTTEAAAAAVERLTDEGLYTIANETIDVSDGGVSGVIMGDVIEFAPDDTPRCVEKPGTASLPRGLGRELLANVYGFPFNLPVPLSSRLEFSLHPAPCGWKSDNVIAWELSEQQPFEAQAQMVWPNNFSRMIGDKTFGLLIAHHLGLPVPLTTVVNRRVAPFSFGRSTNWSETWIRTAPIEQMPGLFPTQRGWTDPFKLLHTTGPRSKNIASVLSQAGVKPVFSGALIVGADGEIIIEGRGGTGIALMLGEGLPEPLPNQVLVDVKNLYETARAALGPVRFEWVHDGLRAWIVQLHRGATESTFLSVTPGEATEWVEFDVGNGLKPLRDLLSRMRYGTGLILKGRVGLTSHVADVIRKARIPAKMA